jgi:NADH-quinone oxidoreductase subunit G
MPIAEVNTLQRLVLIGSFLRKDQPLLAARLRAAVKRGLAVSVIHAVDDDLLMPLAHKAILAPSQWALVLAVVLKQLRSTLALEARPMPAVDPELKNWVDQMVSSSADPAVAQLGRAIALSLQSGDRKAVWLGSAARHHPHYGRLHALAQAITLHCGAVLGELPEGANGVGAWQVGACAASVLGARLGAGAAKSAQAAVHAAQIMAEPRKVYLLYQVEPELDHAAAVACLARLKAADRVIVMSSYRSEPMLGYADCLLPIAPYTESSGTLVNMEGRRQAYVAVVKPPGQARPGWKALRVLADLLQLPGLAFETVEEVRRAAIARADAYPLSNHCGTVPGLFLNLQPVPVLERVAEVPIYATDPVVRRAESLQCTRDARPALLRAHPDTLAHLGARDGAKLRIVQGEGEAILPASADPRVAPGVLRIPAALPATMALAANAEGLGATLA